MLNQTLQIISIVLCGTGLLQVLIGPKRWKKAFQFYVAFNISMAVYSVTILISLTLSGMNGEAVRIILRISVFLEFLSAYFLTFIVLNWLLYRIDLKQQNNIIKTYRTVIWVLFDLQVLLLIISQFTNFYYTIDSSNVYRRMDGYWLHTAIWIAECLLGIFILIRYKKSLSRKSVLSFALFAACAGIGFIIQVFITGVYFTSIASTFVVFVLYLFVVLDNTEKYYENERKISKLKVDIMLSQIQPHFIFNALTTIKYFCRHEPQTAEKAVIDFSDFLRGNMDSLNSEEAIPFISELEHTRAYLSLEKLRFGDALNIVYNIECDDFYLPSLTLQPIVENAVRHGIRETKDGKGTLTITTAEYDDCYKITVTDDGAGFDPSDNSETDGPHIGIQNVRYRLENMCGGTLAVDSAAGQGTVAVISIPKEEQNADLRN